MIIQAHLRQAGTSQPDAPELEHRHVEVDAETCEAGQNQIRADLAKGWIVASWRVDR